MAILGAPLTGLQQNYAPGMISIENKLQAYSATLHAKWGAVDLTSITAYNFSFEQYPFDYSYALNSLDPALFNLPETTQANFATPVKNTHTTDKVTQELRLSTELGSNVEWLFGGYFTHEHSLIDQELDGEILSTRQAATGIDFLWGVTYTEYSAFTNFTVHLSDLFDVQLGGRETHIKQSYEQVDTGPLVPVFDNGPAPFLNPLDETSDNAFTYLLTPRFRISSNLMAYARIASGYRPGGPNPSSAAFGTPPSFEPDKTQNYEIGLKGDVFEHLLSFDTSLYYIDWKDIQLSFVNAAGTASFFSNGSRAKSQGLEISVQSKPLEGTNISAWVAFNQAELTQPLPASSSRLWRAGLPPSL